MRWSEQELAEHLAKKNRKPEQEGACMDSMRVKSAKAYEPKMNKTEARFADYMLNPMLHAKEIIKWEFEPIKLRAMEGKFYKPDFGVWYPGGSITLIEVKAHNLHRSSLDRFQACRERYGTPLFRFELWQWKDQKWTQLLTKREGEE